MMRSIYSKISLIFLLLLITLGVVQILLSFHFSSDFFIESDQKLNRNLASDLAQKFKPFLRDSIHYGAIAHSFKEMMVMNPRVEFYLLDEKGNLLAYFAPAEKIKRMHVDMHPIREFLRSGVSPSMPLYGDDPRSPDRQKPISVSEIQIGSEGHGYLYVILGGEQYDSVISMAKDSYIMRSSAVALAISFVVTALVGLLLFFLLTKRLRRVTTAVSEFETGNYRQRITVDSQDEIGQLVAAFNKMADTITANMEEIQNNDRLRRDLIANISHDLRSPLASVQGYLETILMKNEILPAEERKHFLDIVYKNIIRLNNLVYELFELAKLNARQVKPDFESFSLAELAQDVVLKYKPRAEERKIQLKTLFPERLPFANGDVGMIERALSNLIENAINYTPDHGEVSVQLSRGSGKITVQINDTGKGIPSEDLPHVFERFYRGDKSRTSEGTGLGLAITKKIVETHHSEVSVQSQAGKGTAFSFDLEIAG